ncbi:MAG: Bax inhibitor-1/YccA family membrane protein [Anaeroplasmataceae bacterium]
MRSTNPMFTSVEKNFSGTTENTATYGGIAIKTLILILLTCTSAIGSMALLFKIENTWVFTALMLTSSIVGIFVVIMGMSNPAKSRICSIIYSLLQGILVGSFTLFFETIIPGVAIAAVIITFSIFFSVLIIYSLRIVRDMQKFAKFTMIIGMSAMFISLGIMLVSLFNDSLINFITDNIWLSIGLSAAFLLYGALMLFLNFFQCESIVKSGYPKEAEWTASFGLIITLIYIYIEALRLAAILMSRSRRN